ncbi:MAG: helix-turn-helix domain-containing protein [Polyangiaceae bacterium]|nr:helix-turn-helix domain-containing protein [Polyangiaceae bacterium]
MGNSANRDSAKAAIQERRAQALELRKRGYSYRDVAKALGVSVQVAHAYVKDAIAAIPVEAAEIVRAMELERCDRLWNSLQTKIKDGDPHAVQAAIRVLDRRAKYLGLDAPAVTEITGKDGGPIHISETQAAQDDLLSRLARIAAAGGPGAGGSQPK